MTSRRIRPFLHLPSDSVQISIDIPFADHPYLIGPRGKKCQYLMDRLKTLVHFPDSNRRRDGPKLNTVLISGPMKSAEDMRRQLRGKTPIRLNVDLESLPNPQMTVRRMEEAIADRSLPIRLTYADGVTNIVLKTEWRNETSFVRFCNEFIAAPSPTSQAAGVYTIALSLLPLVNPWNVNLNQGLITFMRDALGCQFLYPPREKFDDQAPYYFIRGESVVRVLQAARFLFGLTMFQISFNVPPYSLPVDQNAVDEWKDSLLVHATFEPIYKMPSTPLEQACSSPPMLYGERVTLRSFEFCINNVYSVRSMLLGHKNTILTPEYNFMDTVINAIPMDVFSTCKLFYPLYSIADEESIELDQSYSSKQFFSHFYGGPYSIRHSTSPDQDLSGMLMDMLNISSDSGAMTQTIDDSNSPQKSPDQTVSSGEIVERDHDQQQQQMEQPGVASEGEAKKRASSI